MNANTLNPEIHSEVIIVGAGPAGATAAYYLAKAGHKVTLLDRQTFPRTKVCGDFVGPVAAKELEALGITKTAEFQKANIINRAAIYIDGEERIIGDIPLFAGLTHKGRVIPRKHLDTWILAAAKEAGATVQENVLVTAFQVKPDGVEINAKTPNGNQTYRAQLLIAADGTNSLIANRIHGQAPKANRNICVRGYFQNIQGPNDRADLHFTTQSFPGYCWLFPTAENSANVGVGVLLETLPKSNQPKDLFFQLINQDEGLKNRLKDAKLVGELEAWPINTYDPDLPLTANRVMLIGDAAGLVNAINGEGIQYALQSGKWAAQCAQSAIQNKDYTQNSLNVYAKHVETELAPGFKISALIIQLIRNRNLNPLWLKTFETMINRSKTDPQYASIAGGILSGTIPPTEGLTAQFMMSTLQEATVSNTLRIVEDTLNDPSSLPKAVIKITETGVQTVLDTAQNPLGFLQWSLETAAKMAEIAFSVPNQVIKENLKTPEGKI
jgi:menaquinone-9 beta-reductase